MSKHSDYLLNRGRSHQDFTDIDNLDRATETFLREQRKSLGRAGINLMDVMDQCKRALVFVVLGVIFATAIVGGIRFQYRENEMRAPEELQTEVTPPVEETLVTEPGQVIQDSSADVSKTNAEGRLTTAPIPGTVYIPQNDTTEPDDSDEPDDDRLATDDTELPTTDVPGNRVEETVPPISRATAYAAGTTRVTVAPSVQQTDAPRTNAVTERTTQRTTQHTTQRTTVPTKKTTTTTTTTTTAEPELVMEYVRPMVSNATEQNGVYTQTVSVQLHNCSEVDAEEMIVRLYCPSSGGITRVVDNVNSCRVSYSSQYITVTFKHVIGGYGYGSVNLTVTSNGPITSCSVK